MSKKIAIIGAHGTGKTHLCTKLHYHCVRNGHSAAYIPEAVRLCPLPIKENQTGGSSLWICCKQIQLELEAEQAHSEFIICDRSVIDPIVYLVSAKPRDLNPDVVDFVEKYAKSYDKLYLVKPSHRTIEGDSFRQIDKESQYAIHDIFTNWVIGRCTIIESEDIFGEKSEQLIKSILGF